MRGIKPSIFIKHPITQKTYSITEAAKLIGIGRQTLCSRIKNKYLDKDLWKPPLNSSKNSLLPKGSDEKKEEALLNLIPNPTYFDLL